MYYVSKIFSKVKINYLKIEKYLYVLVLLARKLHPYFHAYDTTFLTNQTLQLKKTDALGRMIKWAVESGEFIINFTLKKQ